ncbi:MAG: hypothetical protein GY782_01190 [Gammaproteobacteria bacterium]|nr:hypothetical protein [Gammaproteobacteria bacterium]
MLQQANMVKRMTASGGDTLEAKAGESLRVKWIGCIPSTNDGYLTLSVDRVTVGFYRVQGRSGNHLSVNRTGYLMRNIMQFLDSMGVDVSIPIAEGQTLTVSRYAEAGNVMVVYDRHSAGDILATAPNGSASQVYTFLQYASIGTAPTASQDAHIDTALSPSEFVDFPCNKVVPARHVVEMVGVAACPFVNAEAGPAGFATTFLKFVKDREVLMDPDRNGIPFDAQDAAATADAYGGNFSLIGPGTEILVNTNAIMPGDPLIFEPALRFEAGAELNVFLSLIETGAPTWDSLEDIAFILRVTKQ